MIPPAVGCHLRMAAQCPRQQALWKIVKMCLTNPLFSAIMTTTMINAVMEMTSPLPVFRELPVGARRYWGSDSWLLSSPLKGCFLSRTGRDSPVTGIGIRRLYAADAESGRAVYLPPMGMVPRKSSAFVSFIRTMVAGWKRGLFLLLHNTLPGACQKNVYIHSIY